MTFAQSAHPSASAELLEAAKWYESEQTGLGLDFLEAAESAVKTVLERPHLAPVFPGWNSEPVVRTKSFRVFPYRLLYYITETELTVVAYAHNRRKPNYWKDRL